EVERVAELVLLRIVAALTAAAVVADGMLTEGVLLELRVDLAERLLSDLARATGREFPVVALAADVARFLQHFEELLELVERLRRLFAEQLPQLLLVD